MAAPTGTDNREDQDLNPGQKHYEQNMGAGYVSHGTDQAEAFANDSANHDSQSDTAKTLSDAESQAGGAQKVDDVREEETAPGGWKVNRSENGYNGFNRPKLNKALAFAKKRGGIFGLIALLGVGGGLLASLFGPASMLINLMENASIANDSSSTVLERRFLKVFDYATRAEDPICANRTNSLKCKMGRISNSALTKLEAKGIKPVFDNDADNNDRKKTGYPSKNPTAYTVSVSGQDDVTIEASRFTQYLRDNPKIAAKVLGTGGAFNLRVNNWAGRHITERFFAKFGLEKNGGLADGENKKLTAHERYKAALEKMQSRLPGNEKISSAVEAFKGKIDKQLGKAKKGGTAYMLMVAGCIGVKAPGYIASAAAAVQLAQVMPFAMDLVLSPGSKVKASGVDTEHSVTADDMDTVGVLFTETSPRESDGRLTSALDSQYLQSAINVNTNNPVVSQEYTPGYSILTSPLVTASQQAAEASEPACNVILSPAAMWSAFAVDSAVTVAASATIIGGIIKVVGSIVVSEVAGRVVTEVAGATAQQALTDLASNNKIPTAEGEALGDVTGIALKSFFSAGAAARHIPILKTSQLASFSQTAKKNEEFKREMDIASLSPFDISSQYTFLGSIVHSTQNAILASGVYNGSFTSILSSLARLPSSLSSNVGAATYDDQNCGYAEAFNLDAGANTPAITYSGTGCYGFTEEQDAMGVDQAITLVEDSGWIDENVAINDTTSIQDMVDTQYLKAETPVTEFIETCGDLSTGDYIFNAAGCTVGGASADSPATGQCTENSDGNQICNSPDTEGYEEGTLAPASSEALAAVSVTLVDYQLNQSVMGNDIFVEKAAGSGGGGTAVGRPDGAVDEDRGWTFAPGVDYSQYPCDPRTSTYSERHTIIPNRNNSPATGAIIKLCQIPVPFASGNNANGANLVASVISTNVMDMLTAARNSGNMIRLNDGFRIEFNRGYVSQHTTGLSMDLGVDGGGTICFNPNDTVNGWGSAEGSEAACSRIGGTQYAAYKWLQQNAAQYGFYNYVKEPWHWSTSGK